MEWAVLVKAVPALDTLEFDPAARTVLREDRPLFLNPFDQRALRVALELRRPGERVTVLSLGPRGALVPLREAKAVGADRVVLLSDRAFAGSDSLATVTALATALALIRPEVVLAGAWTTDSETGQVGPELASFLGWPVRTEARSIRRLDGPGSFEVEVETATGVARYRGTTPMVLTVGEKIAKPLKSSPEAVRAVDARSIAVWSAADLGLDPRRVGASGSPTLVGGVALAAPTRTPVRFDRGTVADRVQGAVEALASRLAKPTPPPSPLPSPPPRLAAGRESLVLVTGPSGTLDPATLGILLALRRKFPDGWPSALWIGRAPAEADRALLARAGALAGYLVRTSDRPVDPVSAAEVAEELLIRRPELAVAAFLADPFGRVAAGWLAGRRRLGLVGDAIDLSAGAAGEISWSKPSFGGRTVAEIRCRTHPNLVTFRPGPFVPPEARGPGGFGWTELAIPVPPSRWAYLGETSEVDALGGLDGSDVVVAVGMGVGGPEGIARLRPTLERWGAGLAATRKVVDAGWVPRQLQVGLTGRSLAPRLAVLLGISGAVNHAVGWQRAGTVLAVNRDPAAAVFEDSDVGIVGTVEETLPALDAPVARLLGR
jgi:electron transfer flavoprotein alpha subunit